MKKWQPLYIIFNCQYSFKEEWVPTVLPMSVCLVQVLNTVGVLKQAHPALECSVTLEPHDLGDDVWECVLGLSRMGDATNEASTLETA